MMTAVAAPAGHRHPTLNRSLAAVTLAVAVLNLALSGFDLMPSVGDPALTELARNAGATTVSILPSTRLAVFLVSLAHASVLSFGLLGVAELFRRFAAGDVFVPATGRLLRRFGIALLAYTLLGSPANTLKILAGTWHNTEPGSHIVNVSFGLSSQGMLTVLTAALLIALGQVMHDAARLADDHRQFV